MCSTMSYKFQIIYLILSNRQYYSMLEIYQMNYVDREFLLISPDRMPAEVCVFLCYQIQNVKEVIQMRIFHWTKVNEFKTIISQLQPFAGFQLNKLKIFHKNIELADNYKTLSDYNICSGSTIVMRFNQELEIENRFINPYVIFQRPDIQVIELILSSEKALKEGASLVLISEGTSGSYIIENNEKNKVSIFKPSDEEVNAPNNPRGFHGFLGSDGICRGILSGQCATRQVAAYLLDNYRSNYYNVPATTYVEFSHPIFSKDCHKNCSMKNSMQQQIFAKNGSLQQFIQNDGIAGDFGSSKFSVKQVHKIAMLDIRILNCDRNDGNILVRKRQKKYDLIPIDHGLSFPDNLQIYEEALVWMGYNQSKQPFTQEQLKFIQSMNPSEDAKVLSQKLGFRQICLRNIRLSGILLKKTAGFGLSLYEIGKIMYISDQINEDPLSLDHHPRRSKFEQLVIQAQNLYMDMCESEKQNMIAEFDFSSDQDNEGSEFQTNDSWKNLSLKKKISLPTLKKRDTTYHQQRELNRKKMQGINGIKKTIWKKYEQQNWSQLFYHYFEDLLQTYLQQRIHRKLAKQHKPDKLTRIQNIL